MLNALGKVWGEPVKVMGLLYISLIPFILICTLYFLKF